jgi:hypothetical protein
MLQIIFLIGRIRRILRTFFALRSTGGRIRTAGYVRADGDLPIVIRHGIRTTFSRLNAVEGFFAKPTRGTIQR